jgi:hypothetical protein
MQLVGNGKRVLTCLQDFRSRVKPVERPQQA